MPVKGFRVLVEGYARRTSGTVKASSTAVLVEESGVKVIIDPGMDRSNLLKGLRRAGLSPKDIDYVVLTHYHLDHSLLAGIFENAQVLDDEEVYHWDGTITEHEGKVPGTSIQIIKTPGHALFHCSVLFEDKQYGKVCVAGDLFWWWDDENQEEDVGTYEKLIEKNDPYKKDEKKLKESRERILKLCDWIIPGHGKMFKVPK